MTSRRAKLKVDPLHLGTANHCTGDCFALANVVAVQFAEVWASDVLLGYTQGVTDVDVHRPCLYDHRGPTMEETE